MPLRLSAFLCHPLRLPLYQRAFHSSALLHNHYETLQISPSATPKEVKEYVAAFISTYSDLMLTYEGLSTHSPKPITPIATPMTLPPPTAS